MTERFRKAYDATSTAFIEGTLVKGAPTACGVGNIIASALGGTINKNFEYTGPALLEGEVLGEMLELLELNEIPKKDWGCNSFWSAIFGTPKSGPAFNNFGLFPLLEQRLESLTGYPVQHLAQMEKVFESICKIHVLDYPKYKENPHLIIHDQYRGLSAMYNYMMHLDGETIDPNVYRHRLKQHPVFA